MVRILLALIVILAVSCDSARESPDQIGTIESRAVMGAIAPDTVYRGSFVSMQQGICGLVLIEAGGFAEDARITFNTAPNPPAFEASDGIRADCTAGRMTVIDLVTGQGHEVTAPASLSDAEPYTREYIELLLL
jgi:hypothetical protein